MKHLDAINYIFDTTVDLTLAAHITKALLITTRKAAEHVGDYEHISKKFIRYLREVIEA